ncbi:hypothetical protein [Nocardioides dokdonensis]|uniref:hypothetical protein n=1 Tax=Nocardioides dokdonensis TaxID=450734 RepID=UPI0008369C6B|nr:hypothetical protein [Nocardioides dokdonensis]
MTEPVPPPGPSTTRPARLARRGGWTIAIATALALLLVRVTGDLQAPGMVLVGGLIWGGFLLLVALATHLGGLGEEDLRQEGRPGAGPTRPLGRGGSPLR